MAHEIPQLKTVIERRVHHMEQIEQERQLREITSGSHTLFHLRWMQAYYGDFEPTERHTHLWFASRRDALRWLGANLRSNYYLSAKESRVISVEPVN